MKWTIVLAGLLLGGLLIGKTVTAQDPPPSDQVAAEDADLAVFEDGPEDRPGDRPEPRRDGPPPPREGRAHGEGRGDHPRPDGPPPPRGDRPRPDGPRREGDRGPRPDGPPREGDRGPRREGGREHGGPHPGPGMPGGMMPGMPGMMGGPAHADPEMAKLIHKDQELEHQSHELARNYRQAKDSADREELRQQLAEVVEKHFQVRQERREYEIKQMEEQLERLRKSVTKRTDNKQEIIDRRVSQLTGEEDLGF